MAKGPFDKEIKKSQNNKRSRVTDSSTGKSVKLPKEYDKVIDKATKKDDLKYPGTDVSVKNPYTNKWMILCIVNIYYSRGRNPPRITSFLQKVPPIILQMSLVAYATRPSFYIS